MIKSKKGGRKKDRLYIVYRGCSRQEKILRLGFRVSIKIFEDLHEPADTKAARDLGPLSDPS